MNVELSPLNIHKMCQSHPVSSEREKNTDTVAVTYKVLIHSDSINQSTINTNYCK